MHQLCQTLVMASTNLSVDEPPSLTLFPRPSARGNRWRTVTTCAQKVELHARSVAPLAAESPSHPLTSPHRRDGGAHKSSVLIRPLP